MSYRIQLVGPDRKRVAVSSLDASSTITDLARIIHDEFKIDSDELVVLAGFPPKPVPTDNPDATISECGIKSGDSLTVSRGRATGIKQGDAGTEVIFTIPKNSTGHMIRRDMPPDNSCLFHSIAYTCLDRARDKAEDMRKIVVQTVQSKPRVFNEQVLEQHPSSYVRWISDPKVWGGAIELIVFSEHFETEIVSFDYKYLREDYFGEGKGYKKRAFLIYTGQHYDAMAWAPFGNASDSKDKVVFSTKDDYAWKRAKEYVESLHAQACKEDSSLQFQKEWRKDRDKRKAAVGYSMTGQELGWICVGCTMKNNDQVTSCGTCGLPKSRSVPSAGSASSAPAPSTSSSGGFLNNMMNMFGSSSSSSAGGQWNCKHCTFANKAAATTCEMCALPKS